MCSQSLWEGRKVERSSTVMDCISDDIIALVSNDPQLARLGVETVSVYFSEP